MTIFRLLRSRKHPNFVWQAREIEIFFEDCKLAAPLGFFQGPWPSYREKYFRLTMYRGIKLQFLLSRRDSYIV